MSAPAPNLVSVAGQCQCGRPHVDSLILYSTFEQTREDRNPGERQRRINNATAERFNLHNVKEIVVIDVSGRHVSDDPQFQELFADMRSPDLTGTVLPEQSRLFRPDDNQDYGILDHFKRNRKVLYLPSGPRRIWKATDQFQARIDGAVNGLELSTLKDRESFRNSGPSSPASTSRCAAPSTISIAASPTTSPAQNSRCRTT